MRLGTKSASSISINNIQVFTTRKSARSDRCRNKFSRIVSFKFFEDIRFGVTDTPVLEFC